MNKTFVWILREAQKDQCFHVDIHLTILKVIHLQKVGESYFCKYINNKTAVINSY